MRRENIRVVCGRKRAGGADIMLIDEWVGAAFVDV